MFGSSEKAIQENLREFFGFLRILVHAVTLFLVELARFLSKSVVQVSGPSLALGAAEQTCTGGYEFGFSGGINPSEKAEPEGLSPSSPPMPT